MWVYLVKLSLIHILMMYRCAIREIQTKLEVLDDEFSVENNRNPISFIKTRIKKPNSIHDKLQKMGYEFTTENIQTYLNLSLIHIYTTVIGINMEETEIEKIIREIFLIDVGDGIEFTFEKLEPI